LVQRDGACRTIAGDVHAEELGEVAEVLDLEPCSERLLASAVP
jgi:hypothetical protein